MHHEVRVPANGTREMRIRGARKPEMPLARINVHRALHGAHHERRHEEFLAAPTREDEHLLDGKRVACLEIRKRHMPVVAKFLKNWHEFGQIAR